jgi:hypothetical protein
MKKIIYSSLFFLISISLFAQLQIDTDWEKTGLSSSLPSWFSTTDLERGLAYNHITNNVYVVSRNGGTSIRVMNSEDGSDIGNLDATGISGGTFALNDIGASFDGKLYAINLAIGATSFVKIYKWDNDSDVPSVAFNSDLGGVDNKRIGDKFTVYGSASDNSVKIFLADATNSKIYILGTSDFGETFTLEETIVLPASSFGSTPAVFPIYNDDQLEILITNSNGKSLAAYDLTGTQVGVIPGSIVGTGSNAVIAAEINDVTYLTTFQYGATTENARLVLVGDNPTNAISVGQTPSMFSVANSNGTGDVDIRYNEDGTVTLFVLSTNNGVSAYTISAPQITDGLFLEPFSEIANKQNSNSGFGGDIDVEALSYYVDDTHLYIGVEGKLNTGSSDGIALFVGLSNLSGQGVSAGSALGAVNGGGHVFSAGASSFANDFETHYGFVVNPGGGATDVYIDAVKYVGTPAGQYLGNANQSGSTGTGPSSDGIFTANSVSFAFYNSMPDKNRGWELAIPLSELGNPTSSDVVELFAVVVSGTGWFSDVTVPGNITTGNLGENPNFSTLSGGPFHSFGAPIPVELVSFNSSVVNNIVNLTWATATEVNNSGFEVQRSTDNKTFQTISFVNGKGTSTEVNHYNYTDSELEGGVYFYRLKQIDFDGTFEITNSIEVNVDEIPASFSLNQNYPNPFNPETSISFSVAQNGLTKLVVYNSIGQQVTTLFNKNAEVGQLYKVNFDASKLSSGIYIYSLQQNNTIITKKMTLIK